MPYFFHSRGRRALLLATLAVGTTPPALAAVPTLLNVSYVSREFYKDYNTVFAAHWKKSTGEDITLNQSHGGSSRQARSVVDGLEADVITMNQHNDIDILYERGKRVPQDWAKRLPFNSAPTTSVSVILVRKGNPKKILDWSDLGRPGIGVIIPNPKTSGNGRYTYLAAWGAGIKSGLSPDAAKALVTRIFANVPVLPPRRTRRRSAGTKPPRAASSSASPRLRCAKVVVAPSNRARRTRSTTIRPAPSCCSSWAT